MSRFTIKIAERMATDCGLPCTGRELLPVLRAAEAAHDAALAQMEEARDKPLQNERRKRDQKFVTAARNLWQAWQAMDRDGRGRLAWSAVYGTPNAAKRWLREAMEDVAPSAKVPYGVNYGGVEQRIEQMIVALGTLPRETPHLPVKSGTKEQLGGLKAAQQVFKGAWRDLAGSGWYPLYSKARSENRKAQNPPAQVLLAFAQRLKVSKPYTLANCAALNRSRSK